MIFCIYAFSAIHATLLGAFSGTVSIGKI